MTSLVLAFSLTACGGGGSATPGAGPKPAPVVTAWPASSATVNVNIANVGGGSASTQAGHRSAKFVSPSTNASVLTVSQNGAQFSQTITNLSVGSSNCTTSTPRSCTIPLVLPAGTFSFVLQTYDAAPVAGAIPASAQLLATASTTASIVADQPNNVLFVLSAIVTGATGNGSTNAYASEPANGTAQLAAISVTATDADGNTITGTSPYAAAIPVAITETGGSGHSSLVINGANVGLSGTLTKPTDTLAVLYDGGGSVGYTTVTTIDTTTTVRISPMYLTPGSATVSNRTSTQTSAVSEASAPISIAYSSPSNTCGSEVTSASVTGSGPSATLSFGTTAAGGYSATCTVVAEDVLGTQLAFAVTFLVAGPIAVGAPTFTGGGSGSCASTLSFTGTGQSAALAITDPNYTGSFSVVSSQTSVATASVSGSSVTIAAVAAGTSTVTIADTAGNSFPCSVGVTTSTGSVQ